MTGFIKNAVPENEVAVAINKNNDGDKFLPERK